VALVGRAAALLGARGAGLLGVLLLVFSPLALHYAAEVNDYPLALLLVAWMTERLAAWRRGLCAWWGPALVAVLCAWTHLFAGLLAALALLALLGRSRREFLSAALFVGLGVAPLAFGVSRLLSDEHTFGQPTFPLAELLRDAWDRFGSGPALLLLLALPGLRVAPSLAIPALGGALSLLLLIASGAAASHQFPTWTLLLPFFTLLAALAASRRRALLGFALLLVGFDALRALHEEVPRLRAPALEPDDDKRATSPVLWRLPPWLHAPISRPFDFDTTDWRYGQPRRVRGALPDAPGAEIVLFTFTDFYPGPMDEILAHATGGGARVWIALYDHAPAHAYPETLRATLGAWRFDERSVGGPRELGRDLLFVVTGPEASLEAPR
jgi:hypothetical protein